MTAPATYYDVAMRRLDEQIQRIDALDTKAGTALGAAAALLPLFGALFAAFNKNPPEAAVVLYFISFSLYLGMVYCAVRGTRVGEWDLRPDLPTLATYGKTKNEATVQFWVASECEKAIATNRPKLETKALYVDLSLVGLVLVTLLLTTAALIQLVT